MSDRAASLETRASAFFAALQDEITAALGALEQRAAFREDVWSYEPTGEHGGRGGGRSRVIERGELFEKGGVNLADVEGRLTPRIAERLGVEAQPFRAAGVSLVMHPLSPMVPTVHMNVRLIRTGGRTWFGGGADLTPSYLEAEDAAHFHRTLREACDRHACASYAEFKRWCDDYFQIKHRGEARGVGGIFFDYLERDLEAVFAFVQEVGRAFLPAYLPIVERRRGQPWWDRERDWQLLRRGRYVEFNLVYDRGTLFGLETQGRAESILMSLPPRASWVHDHEPAPGSREAELLAVLREPRDWV